MLLLQMDGVKINNLGDYQENEMYNRFNKPELYTGVVSNWKKLGTATTGPILRTIQR
mgnify:CR=1 FL=1